MKIIILFFLILTLSACNNNGTIKKSDTEEDLSKKKLCSQDSINIIMENFTLSSEQLNCLKFSSLLRNRFFFFNEIGQKDFVSIKTIKHRNINLIYFDFSEDTYFNFISYNNQIIFNNDDTLYKTKLVRELRDWDNDGFVDFIEKFTICEAGCVSEKKYNLIYQIIPDSVFVKHKSNVIIK